MVTYELDYQIPNWDKEVFDDYNNTLIAKNLGRFKVKLVSGQYLVEGDKENPNVFHIYGNIGRQSMLVCSVNDMTGAIVLGEAMKLPSSYNEMERYKICQKAVNSFRIKMGLLIEVLKDTQDLTEIDRRDYKFKESILYSELYTEKYGGRVTLKAHKESNNGIAYEAGKKSVTLFFNKGEVQKLTIPSKEFPLPSKKFKIFDASNTEELQDEELNKTLSELDTEDITPDTMTEAISEVIQKNGFPYKVEVYLGYVVDTEGELMTKWIVLNGKHIIQYSKNEFIVNWVRNHLLLPEDKKEESFKKLLEYMKIELAKPFAEKFGFGQIPKGNVYIGSPISAGEKISDKCLKKWNKQQEKDKMFVKKFVKNDLVRKTLEY